MSGRGTELYHLFTRAKRAFAGAGVAVVITGESGAGKTSTLDAVQSVAAAAGQPCCASTCR